MRLSVAKPATCLAALRILTSKLSVNLNRRALRLEIAERAAIEVTKTCGD
jgi:hypothetical protein